MLLADFTHALEKLVAAPYGLMDDKAFPAKKKKVSLTAELVHACLGMARVSPIIKLSWWQ